MYDVEEASYLDEMSARLELARTLNTCLQCRRCELVCSVFDLVFDSYAVWSGGDSATMTPNDQDRVVQRCVNGGACTAICPYTDPAAGADRIDLPAAVLRVAAVNRAAGRNTYRSLLAKGRRLVGRADNGPCRYGGVDTADGLPVGCCGLAALQDGDLSEFARRASELVRNSVGLAPETTIAVSHPGCRRVIRDVIPERVDRQLGVGSASAAAELARRLPSEVGPMKNICWQDNTAADTAEDDEASDG